MFFEQRIATSSENKFCDPSLLLDHHSFNSNIIKCHSRPDPFRVDTNRDAHPKSVSFTATPIYVHIFFLSRELLRN